MSGEILKVFQDRLRELEQDTEHVKVCSQFPQLWNIQQIAELQQNSDMIKAEFTQIIVHIAIMATKEM
jgi:DnaJ-domain-containing protein 1